MEKLGLIIPYRNREEHKNTFIPAIKKYLDESEIPYKIIFVEQCDNKAFNRGKLLNIGFQTFNSLDYFCFHDVDMIPIDSDYSFVDAPTHLATSVEQFGWKLPYDGYFGGVTLFDKKSFEKINGYSNEYWGWGAEDDDVVYRCGIYGIETFRKECSYQSLSHERKVVSTLYQKNVKKLTQFQNSNSPEKLIELDGISTLKYKLKNDPKEIEKDVFWVSAFL